MRSWSSKSQRQRAPGGTGGGEGTCLPPAGDRGGQPNGADGERERQTPKRPGKRPGARSQVGVGSRHPQLSKRSCEFLEDAVLTLGPPSTCLTHLTLIPSAPLSTSIYTKQQISFKPGQVVYAYNQALWGVHHTRFTQCWGGGTQALYMQREHAAS